MPDWVPQSVSFYLAHTETGLPIRELARMHDAHASTILRQIRRVETRRDDPLVDAALRSLGKWVRRAICLPGAEGKKKEVETMTALPIGNGPMADQDSFDQEALRVLRRLCETGAMLAVAADMEKSVVVREKEAGGPGTRTAVVDRAVVETMALRDWIATDRPGRISRYRITPAGRTALETLLESYPEVAFAEARSGFAETPADFAEQHRSWGEKSVPEDGTGRVRRVRYNLAESPLTGLARRRDKNGAPFLSDDLVSAGERLREDFELAQMGPRVAQNWERFLTGGGRGDFSSTGGQAEGPERARRRVVDALSDLGPGLSDIALRCCCFLEGLETTEKRLGWSARSGKIVLRIALHRLKRHYDEVNGSGGGLIG